MLDLVTLNKNNQPTTTSKILADRFNKVHRDVVRAINNLDIPEDFRVRNFAQSKFKADNINGLEYDCYEMTRDGFTLLAMGFTGKKAMEWKVKFIEAFNRMEAALKQNATVPSLTQDRAALKAIGGIVKKCAAVAVREELEKVKVVEYVNPVKNLLSDDLLTESSLTPMEIKMHLNHLLTGLWDYKKSSADMYKLYRLLEACKALACRYHSYANHLQGGVDFCEHYRGKNDKYFELNTDSLYATIRGMLDTRIELSAL